MELNKVLDKVRKLVAKAEHENTAPAEAEIYRAQADALMLKYAIEEASLDASRPAVSRMRPEKIEVELGDNSDLISYIAKLAQDVARHCRCQIRSYARYDWRAGTWMSKVYGFESDLRYFEILYTTLRLQMVGASAPTPDAAKSLDENVYVLHSAGFNWWEIAEGYGWRGPVRSEPGEPELMYVNRVTGERASWGKSVGSLKSAYRRELKRRGEEWLKIPPTGAKTFRRSAADGYAYRIEQRLRALRERQGTGAAVVLRSRADDLSLFFREDNPDLFRERQPCPKCARSKSGYCRDHRPGRWTPAPFSEQGYAAGVRQANAASLDPEASSSGHSRALPR
jgi:Protein of unknown function (DUF2786)